MVTTHFVLYLTGNELSSNPVRASLEVSLPALAELAVRITGNILIKEIHL